MSQPTLADKWVSSFRMTIDRAREAEWSPVPPGSSSSTQPGIGTLKSSFHLPVTSTRLFCISRGDLSSGNIRIAQSDRVSDFVLVHVTVELSPGESHAKVDVGDFMVCVLKRKETQYGIGIFTSTSEQHPDDGLHSQQFRMHFTILIEFPKPKPTSTTHLLKIRNFETDMPLFSHQVDNLAPGVDFRTISLRTSAKPILVDSLRARKAYCETSNSSIEGTFIASTSLKLITANAHIRASVRLENADPRKFTELTMSTSNGPIFGSITLSAPSSSKSPDPKPERGGNFFVNASTNNFPLTITFPSAPPLCNLHIRAISSIGEIDVTLPETYEGSFKVTATTATTGTGRAEVVQCPSRRDSDNSRGQGKRNVEFEVDEEAVTCQGWMG